MKTPLPFILEKGGKLILNEEVISIIKNSNNPKFISFYGSTRGGKSTTLNQLISSNSDDWSYVRKEPFKTGSSVSSVTSGCDIYGPIKFSQLKKKHHLSGLNSSIKEDFDIFFCDTEGIDSLNKFNRLSIPGILIILQICTISIFMVHKNCKETDFKEICSLLQFTKILNKELKLYPRVGVYISNMLPGDDYAENDENNDADYNTIKEIYDECYRNSVNEQRKLIIDRAKEKYPNLDFHLQDVEIIAGGPYLDEKKPQKDLKLQLYWCSIHEIFNSFLKFYRDEKKKKEKENQNGNFDIIALIRTLFEIFSEIDKLDDDFNLRNFFINYLEKKFDTYSKKQFALKLEKIKKDISSNFLLYIELLNNDNKAKESISECFQKEFLQIYKQLIPKKIQNFIDLSLEQYRKYIRDQIEHQFKLICEKILSPQNIESLIKNVKDMIIKAEFKEDINMKEINNTENFWNIIYKKNEIILNYFKETNSNILNNLKENFISEINKIFQNIMSKKIMWKNYLKDSLVEIQKDINKIYSDIMKQCNYQEDFDKCVKKSDEFYKLFFPEIKKKYFNSLSNNRLKEVEQKVSEICKEEYNKLLDYKLPKWGNIKNSISSRIKDCIENYFDKIFKGIEFKDQMDPNLGRKDVLLNKIPLEVKENSQIKGDKSKVIHNLIENEIEKAVNIFKNKRESLPLFSEYIEGLISKCKLIIDNKMKETIDKFHYLEEKKTFNSDFIFAFLTRDQTIYQNCSSKVKEVNIKIRELCNDKEKEYDLLVQRTKPEWNKIKSEKISKINDICKEYLKKYFSGAKYQEDIKNLDLNKLKKIIINTNAFYSGVTDNKKNEINAEIDDILSKLEDKINAKKGTLRDWNSVKSQLIQKAYFEMIKKSKTNLKTKDATKIIEILISHLDTIPKFYDPCKTEQRKMELISELKATALSIANDYIKRIQEEEKKEEEHKRQMAMAEAKIKEMQRKAEEERRKREEEERRRREEEERRRREEEARRIAEEAERRRREEEARRIAEENRINDLARRTINGEFGNGAVRRQRLGGDFARVQNRVNEILGFPKRY